MNAAGSTVHYHPCKYDSTVPARPIPELEHLPLLTVSVADAIVVLSFPRAQAAEPASSPERRETSSLVVVFVISLSLLVVLGWRVDWRSFGASIFFFTVVRNPN